MGHDDIVKENIYRYLRREYLDAKMRMDIMKTIMLPIEIFMVTILISIDENAFYKILAGIIYTIVLVCLFVSEVVKDENQIRFIQSFTEIVLDKRIED